MCNTSEPLNPQELLRLHQQIAHKKLLVVGDVMLDTYIFGRTDRVSREAPVPVIVYSDEKHLLGGAGNAARNGVDLGARVSLLAIVGDDEAGRQIQAALIAGGIDDSALIIEKGRQSLNKLRVMAGAEGTARQQVLRLDRGQLKAPTQSIGQSCAALLRLACDQAQALVVSDYGGHLFDATMLKILQDCATKKPVIIDSRYHIADFRGPFYLKPNAQELRQAVPLAAKASALSDKSLHEAISNLRSNNQAKAVLSTHGRQGMILLDTDGQFLHQPIFGPAEVTDVTGAGDTVASSFALALATGASAKLAMQFATVCAGIVVQKPGAATVTDHDLDEAMHSLERP